MKKGFTLVELLGVTVLLALIMAVSYPSLFKIFDDKQDEIDLYKKQTIENAAINYVKININEYPYKDGSNNCLFVKTLIEQNKLSDNIYENLENRIIKINMLNNQYSAQILNENETCTTNGTIYEIKTCTQNLSSSNYKLTNKKTNYYIGTKLNKQTNVIEGKNINNANTFKNQIVIYDNLNYNLNNIENISSIIDKNDEYFTMQVEIDNPDEVVIPSGITNIPFYDTTTSKIKTTCE